jgi:hypothetical protein
MKPLSCRCGRPVYFDNLSCSHCGRELGFDPGALEMRSEVEPGDGLAFCANRTSASRCNWLADRAGGRCLSCRMSRVIPALSKLVNQLRWRKLEQAKRRLIYDLLCIGLPVDDTRLAFQFKEDRRTNPDVGEDHVTIGHRDGVITINAAEADEVYREQMREQMQEPYRTLLGHFRHESGHYYFGVVVGAERIDEARSLFGDESVDYDAALERYYRDGPADGWPARYISGYASAHPAEDWAECWAHYLHIRAVLEAAVTTGIGWKRAGPGWQGAFIDLVLVINEIMHSLGLPDAYPFVITDTIAEKIDFVHRAVEAVTGRRDGPWTVAN